MKSIVLFVCLTSGLFSMETVSAQSATTISVQPFPEQCIGTWKGMMHIYAYGNLRDSVQVELNVVKIDDNSWKWRTDYLSEKMPVTKDYLMRLDPKSANTFLLDEGGWHCFNELPNRFKTLFQFRNGGNPTWI